MTNKLVVIINSLKVPKIKKILLYEMKFLVPNYSCYQNPRIGVYHPQIPVLSVLCPQLNLLNPPPKKIPGYATGRHCDWATGCTAEESRFGSLQEPEIVFSKASTPGARPTYSLIHLVSGIKRPGSVAYRTPSRGVEVKTEWSCPETVVI